MFVQQHYIYGILCLSHSLTAVEYVVFVKPSDLQLSIYAQILGRKSLEGLIEGSMTRSLALINNLTKISNSPLLLRINEDDKVGEDGFSSRGCLQDVIRLLPHGATLEDFSLSGLLCCYRTPGHISHFS